MQNKGYNSYQRASVEAADPVRIIVMLYEANPAAPIPTGTNCIGPPPRASSRKKTATETRDAGSSTAPL